MLLLFIDTSPAASRGPLATNDRKHPDGPDRALVLDGSSVHTVGQLQMHVTNWGAFGSQPGIFSSYSWAPSAQWPAGSGAEHLGTAGLWVGALLPSGVPAVSTAAFEQEFRPRLDARDVIYESTEGSDGGKRRPHPHADDDGDGKVDEDRLDGYDNDGDGLVDEDYAAVSRQMFTSMFSDFEPQASAIYPNHNPLQIMVRQRSYQWDANAFDDFVAVEYQVTNVGGNILSDVYVGVFADADIGPRTGGNYWDDDLTGSAFVDVACTKVGPATIDLAYTYDADGDNGRSPGYFAIAFLGLPGEDESNIGQPRISTFASFSGSRAFASGGDPTNDFERYELMSRGTIARDAVDPRDYRMLISTGPVNELSPGGTLTFQIAFAVGAGLAGIDGVIANLAAAQVARDGAWFDLDHDATTGVQGRESVIFGPQDNVQVDSCKSYLTPIPELEPGEAVWVNEDCAEEEFIRRRCGYGEADSVLFRTATAGRESKLRWFANMAPPPPNMRVDDHAAGGVAIYWDNFSELASDPQSGEADFEGYQLWWADGWTRPAGSSEATGPAADLWIALARFDLLDGLGDDTGLGHLRYEPLTQLMTPATREAHILKMTDYLIDFPTGTPPCPPQTDTDVCDTLIALARWRLGLPGGRQYYRYVDDDNVTLGARYFYSVVAFDFGRDPRGRMTEGSIGSPSSNFVYAEPQSVARDAWAFDADEVYVVPNPVTNQSMAAWQLDPTNTDPTGTKLEFRNLPMASGRIRIYTLYGDFVKDIPFDGRSGDGTASWNLVTRNGQDIASGIYLFTVDVDSGGFSRVVGKFTVIR